jgi:hypothetical protein
MELIRCVFDVENLALQCRRSTCKRRRLSGDRKDNSSLRDSCCEPRVTATNHEQTTIKRVLKKSAAKTTIATSTADQKTMRVAKSALTKVQARCNCGITGTHNKTQRGRLAADAIG